MIVFDLACAAGGHVFEAWFGSTSDYEDQLARGLVQCPICGSAEIRKAVMAPRLSAKGNRKAEAPAPAPANLTNDMQDMKRALAALAQAQKQLLAKSESVGDRFADEARAIHLGESAPRQIHGRATTDQAQSLIEEGIAVAPLPFPIIEPDQAN